MIPVAAIAAGGDNPDSGRQTIKTVDQIKGVGGREQPYHGDPEIKRGPWGERMRRQRKSCRPDADRHLAKELLIGPHLECIVDQSDDQQRASPRQNPERQAMRHRERDQNRSDNRCATELRGLVSR